MADRQCEGCQFWNRIDITPKKIGNVGQCSALMARTGGFYDKSKTSPFWANNLSYQTTSWEGTNCNAWKKKDKRA